MSVPVCLTMIVKNEEAVITRGIASVLPYITHYAICDTGSTDSTVEVIEKYMAEHSIKGKVFHHPWKNFGHNRSLSLAAAREICPDGWAWVLDADDVIEGEMPNNFLSMIPEGVNGINITIKQGATRYERIQIFRNSVKWCYERSLHEYPALMAGEKSEQKIANLPETIWNISSREGARNADPIAKYKKDASVLMEDLAKYPNDPRTLFYLANSWRDAGVNDKALKYYKKRADLKNGWDQEKYMSMFHIIQLESNFETKLETAWKAYELDPRRLDVQFLMMAEGIKQRKKLHQIYAMAIATTNRTPQRGFLFIDTDLYGWKYDELLMVLAFTCKHYEEAVVVGERALKNAPEREQTRIKMTLDSVKAQIEVYAAADKPTSPS